MYVTTSKSPSIAALSSCRNLELCIQTIIYPKFDFQNSCISSPGFSEQEKSAAAVVLGDRIRNLAAADKFRILG